MYLNVLEEYTIDDDENKVTHKHNTNNNNDYGIDDALPPSRGMAEPWLDRLW